MTTENSRVEIADILYFDFSGGKSTIEISRLTIDKEGSIELQKTHPPISPFWMPEVRRNPNFTPKLTLDKN